MVCATCVSAGKELTAGNTATAALLHRSCLNNDPNKKNACDCQHRLESALAPALTKAPESDSLEGHQTSEEGTG